MEIQSYSDLYLPYVAENIGTMFEKAVSSGENPITFWNIFVNSTLAKQIENGNPKYLTCSSIDYLDSIYNGEKNFKVKETISKNKYYWVGWALAQLQQKKGISFYKINNSLPVEKVIDLYNTLHEADITKFIDVANTYFKKNDITNLKRLRNARDMSQSELAKESNVELRSIQMYEQRKNDINKAQAETLYKLSKALGCSIEDLLEN